MENFLSVLLWPTLACLVLTGIHTYLGWHVVERGVIFVDLSLAQVAVLGATVAVGLGFDPHSVPVYLCSLGSTMLGAGLFATTRAEKSRIPQEAIIGIVYVVCAAGVVLIMDRLPHGAESLKHTLVGNLLAVNSNDVIKVTLLYLGIGFLHWLWRKPLLLISTQIKEAKEKGYRIKIWDFIFYALFGVVVTSSVAMAGVLLVFSFLIIPAVGSMLFYKDLRPRLILGWGLGAGASLLGIALSYQWDTPTGATVICAFGFVLALLAILRKTMRSF